MRKLVLLLMIFFIGFTLIACDNTDSNQTNDDPKNDDPVDEYIPDEGGFPTEEANVETLIDYSDDERELIDVSNVSDDTVLTFEDEKFEEAIRWSLHLEDGEPILYSEVKEVTVLRLFNWEITSIKGIEYFENLEELYLTGNGLLASVNGVQTLSSLKFLDISHTSVKKIIYDNSSLNILEARYSNVDLTKVELETLFIIMPNLRRVLLSHTPFMMTNDIIDFMVSTKDLEQNDYGRYLRVDVTQIDFRNFDYGKVYEFDDEGTLIRKNNTVDIEGIEFSFEEGSKYIDISNPSEVSTIESLVSLIEEDTLYHGDLPRGVQMIILYDYLVNLLNSSSESSEYIVDALEGQAVTSKTAYHTMALVYRYYGFYAYIDEFYLLSYGESNFEFRQNVLYVEYQGQLFACMIDDEDTYRTAFIGHRTLIDELNILIEDHDFVLDYDFLVATSLHKDLDRTYINEIIEEIDVREESE